VLRRLAALRRRFLRYFTEGEYRHVQGLTASGCTARLDTHGGHALVIAVNPTDTASRAAVGIDPTAWGGAAAPMRALLHRLGREPSDLEDLGILPARGGESLRCAIRLGADDLAMIEVRPVAAAGGPSGAAHAAGTGRVMS
jgi:hypothetical protein